MADVIQNFKNNVDKEFSKKDALGSPEGLDSFNNLKNSLPEELEEKWSEEYKKSIDCKNPKGFSQRAHCQGRKKRENKEATGSGSAGGYVAPLFSTIKKGETKENNSAKEQFSKDIQKDPDYIKFKENAKRRDETTGVEYNFGTPNVINFDPYIHKPKYSRVGKLKDEDDDDEDIFKTETKEATGSGSSGSYSQPSIWAKSQSKKDWRGAKKTQIPGGKFVTVKEKCKKFPYCNQGDIKALKLYENETIKKVIKNIVEKHNISENVVKTIIQYELEKIASKLNK
jgi:hypothetical protein